MSSVVVQATTAMQSEPRRRRTVCENNHAGHMLYPTLLNDEF